MSELATLPEEEEDVRGVLGMIMHKSSQGNRVEEEGQLRGLCGGA
jgi:hypothetical protein